MSARNRYAKWALGIPAARTRQRSHLSTYDEAATSGLAFELQELTGLRLDEAAWLAGVTCHVAITHPELLKWVGEPQDEPGFIYTWATCAPNLRASQRVDINERRFERWLNAATDADALPAWYGYTLEALKVVRGKPFDIRTLFDIARLRALHCADELPPAGPRTFSGYCALEFYNHQPQGLSGAVPRQIPTEELIGL